MTNIILTEEEFFKFEIITKLIGGSTAIEQAREQLGLSTRQIKCLKRCVIDHGAEGAVHGLRGKPAHNRTMQTTADDASKLLKERYPDSGPTFAAEKLNDIHDIASSKERVRILMTKLGHHWFEDRVDECCLLAAIDDATGRITKAEFGMSEGIEEASSFWEDCAMKRGKPQGVYLDKCGTYGTSHKNAVDNHELMTRFRRMMKELDVRLITAHSPEAKGRIERLFGTLQDGLAKGLRLASIGTIPEANIFLETLVPKFNAQFEAVAAGEGDLHRPLAENEKENLDAIFSIQSTRKVRNDFTIQFENQRLQLEKTQPCAVLRNDAVFIEQRLDHTLHIRLRKHYLVFKILPTRPEKIHKRVTALVPRKPWRPSENHPWKKTFKRPLRQGWHSCFAGRHDILALL